MEIRPRFSKPSSSPHSPKASDALPLPLYLTNTIFFTLFFSLAYFLLQRWREKIHNSTPLHVLTFSELAAVVALIASFIYLLGFFGIDFVQSFIARGSNEGWEGVGVDKDEYPRRFSDHEGEKRGEKLAMRGKIESLLHQEVVSREKVGPKLGIRGKIECLLDENNEKDHYPRRFFEQEGEKLGMRGKIECLLGEDDDEGVNGEKDGCMCRFFEQEGEKRGQKWGMRGKNECLLGEEDEEVVEGVVKGEIALYALESRLGDCGRAAFVRRVAVERMSGSSLEGLGMEGFDYESILGQCCEMPIGYVQIPVGVVGPLLVNGCEYMVPIATTEGCLVASTNRGCKAIYASGGATCRLFRNAMTRAPVVRFGTAKRACDLMFFLEDPLNFGTLAAVFNKSTRFGRLKKIQCSIAGRNLYIRFSCFTGDAMGMNMVSKGVQYILEFLQTEFPDMDVIGVSGNFCSDKKPSAVNWIEGRGKSVVCEAIITEEVLQKVLKTSVPTLAELNMLKNLTGSALAGSVGGFNAHAANIVSAIFIATGQDPAQNIESSSCMTMMEAVNDGKDLHVSVTMPSIEVGTIGGGTQLASQSACLNLLGVKGGNKESPGSNSSLLAMIIAGAVLAGELNLMSAISTGQLVNSHMKYNRSSKDVSQIV